MLRRLRRSVICSEEGNQCSFMDEATFCEIYPRWCPSYRKKFLGVSMSDHFIHGNIPENIYSFLIV